MDLEGQSEAKVSVHKFLMAFDSPFLLSVAAYGVKDACLAVKAIPGVDAW